ncbi:hypothetical protein AVEN_44650-1 [Araneus ventricosus]|uniref:Uncharacterized protein n=1 Tax=Araneus ventricosus TaxID=182803 RepID=A0A4Y2G9P1_ARAVE|nr:hypothetical protein AVEN_44650-1 [Araneus ventricosus]
MGQAVCDLCSGSLERGVPAQVSSSSSDKGSTRRDPSPSNPLVPSKWNINITNLPAGAPAQILTGLFIPCFLIRSQNCLKVIAIPSCDPSLQDYMGLSRFQRVFILF